jgi:hypothetical protein
MASLRHEVLVEFFRTRPSLAAEILTEVLGLALPRYTEARVASADLTEVKPVEYRADLVVTLLDGKVPVRVVVVEVQLGVDLRKRRSWPAYVSVAHAEHGCLVDLLVIAPDTAVAAWCAQPIPLGPPGFVLTPPVLRRDAVPVVTDPAEAARRLQLGMLSLMAHADTEQAVPIAGALLPVIDKLDEDRARFYYDLLINSLDEAARRALETKMKGYEYQSEFAKKYVALGRDEGRSEGRADEAARNLLTVLRVRGIAVPDAARDSILAERDPARLERWHERAILAPTLAEVLDEPS